MVVLTTFSQPTEGVRHRQPSTTAYVNDNNLGKGTLYIAENCLSWISDSGDGFSIEYPNISLHAVSRDLAAFPQECLFLMLDIALGDEETKNGDGENEDNNDGSDNDDDQVTTELRFVPNDRGMLDAMFHAMNACQALHPDPEDSVSDEDFYEDMDNDIQMEETDYRMANLNMGLEEFWNTSASLDNNRRELEQRGILGLELDEGEGRAADMAEGRAADMAEGRLVDMAEGRLVDMGEGRVVIQPDRAQGDRPFHLGSSGHQDNLAALQEVHTSHTSSHFSDAES